MLYRIRYDLVAIPAAVYLQPVLTCIIGFEVAYRYSATQILTVNRSFLTQSVEHVLYAYLSMSANCNLTCSLMARLSAFLLARDVI